jgi:hypothetical protein
MLPSVLPYDQQIAGASAVGPEVSGTNGCSSPSFFK